MSDGSHIAWTDATWNVMAGCKQVSSGCAHCYAIPHAARMAGNPHPSIRSAYEGLTERHGNGRLDWEGSVRFLPDRLPLPTTWTKPRRIFVNSMSDLFHEEVKVSWIDRVWAVMEKCPHHTFQILTKRPQNALSLLTGQTVLPNVWIGVSVEDQATAESRLPVLARLPAALRFISYEPALGRVNLYPFLRERNPRYVVDLNGPIHAEDPATGKHVRLRVEEEVRQPFGWVIAGGESGPGARLCVTEHLTAARLDCACAGVPFFLKQLGSHPYWSGQPAALTDPKGADPEEWPEAWRVREFPR